MDVISLVLIMLLAVVFSGFISRILPRPIPLPLIQIALGTVIAVYADFHVALEPDIFFLLFLPPLLFLDGWRISKTAIRDDKWIILELSLGLVIFTVVGMGYFIDWLIPDVPFAVAFALAAVLSPTDPVAVSSIASRTPIPKRLMHILHGESLLNDASGLVCLRFAIAAALTGTFSLPDAIATFSWLALGGISIGIALTWVVMKTKNILEARFGEEPGVQVLVSLLIPFGAYIAAEQMHCSGILATVAAGITMSFVEASGWVQATTRVRRSVVWDTLEFTANGVVFILLGQQFPKIFDGAMAFVNRTDHSTPWLLAAYLIIITTGLITLRFVWVWTSLRFTMLRAHYRGREFVKPPMRIVAAMSLAGVRGAITLAGVMSLPALMLDGTAFPARDLVIFLAAGVIILSLLIATCILPAVMRGLQVPSNFEEDGEQDYARNAAAKAAIQAIDKMQKMLSNTVVGDEEMYAQAASRVINFYTHRVENTLKTGYEKQQIKKIAEIERQLRLAGLKGEREELFKLARERKIEDGLMRELVRKIDLLEARERA